MSDTPTREPRKFTAGETVVFEKSLDDYRSTDDWALTYHLRGPGSLDHAAAAQAGGSFLVAISAAQTAELQPGKYYVQAWVSKGDRKFRVWAGEFEVEPGLAAALESYDGRSKVKKILDAIDALVANKATVDQQQYSIAGGGGYRMLSKIAPTELLALRKEYARLYAQERRRTRVRRGGTLFRTIKVRFDEPR